MTVQDIKDIQTTMHEEGRHGITMAREFFDSLVDCVDRQQTEIERLQSKLEKLYNKYKNLRFECVDEVTEWLLSMFEKHENDITISRATIMHWYWHQHQSVQHCLDRALSEKCDKDSIRAEAIKEFAERLKESNRGILSCCIGWVDFDDIDNLVKEMVGEQG